MNRGAVASRVMYSIGNLFRLLRDMVVDETSKKANSGKRSLLCVFLKTEMNFLMQQIKKARSQTGLKGRGYGMIEENKEKS